MSEIVLENTKNVYHIPFYSTLILSTYVLHSTHLYVMLDAWLPFFWWLLYGFDDTMPSHPFNSHNKMRKIPINFLNVLYVFLFPYHTPFTPPFHFKNPSLSQPAGSTIFILHFLFSRRSHLNNFIHFPFILIL